MSKSIVHIVGNGDKVTLMPERLRHEREGKLLVCNIPPFEVSKAYACCIVDFKMMKNLHKSIISLDAYKWVLGNRPKIYMDQHPSFYMQHAYHIREFYTTVPKYCGPRPDIAATNFNCGHMAVHYACAKMKATERYVFTNGDWRSLYGTPGAA